MKILAFTLLVIVVLALLGCGGGDESIGGRLPTIIVDWEGHPGGLAFFPMFEEYQPEDEIIARIGDGLAVPRQVVADMLTAAGLTLPGDDWELLTLGQAQEIKLAINPRGHGIYVTEQDADTLVSYALWVDLYKKILQERGVAGVEMVNLVPLSIGGGRVHTNLGMFNSKAPVELLLTGQEIQVLTIGDEILAVVGLVNQSPILRNVAIISADAFGVTGLIGGAERFFLFCEDVEILPEDVIIANLQLYRGEVIAVTAPEVVIGGRIMQITSHIIELAQWGVLPLCPQFQVYRIYPGEGISQGCPQDLLVGYELADFHIINGRVGAATVVRRPSPTYIRVAISTTGFAGLVHNSVTISGTGPFTVTRGSLEETFAAGERITVSHERDLWGEPRLYISPVNPEHRLEIIGLGRNWPAGQHPAYRGRIEISQHTSGGFIIINELTIEEYLYAVVPSEMPSSFGVEASKVQAVTARSFAYHQFYMNLFRDFGAHVDDSVMSQVYNNIPENEISIAAVRATRGQVLVYDGEIALTNYFSTSSGMTANFGETWASGEEFPADTPVFLRATPQFYMADHNPGDLRKEHYAAVFFRSQDIPGFDREFPWFRWHVRLTAEELTQRINAGIRSRQPVNPAMIQTYGSFGSLTAMEIIRRGQGGNIMEIKLTGTTGSVTVKTEFNIRSLLAPGRIPVTRQDGSQTSNMTLLPSAFFTFEKEHDPSGQLVAITFYGGGHGHGVGMSQNGAAALLNTGLTYRDVLRHFYPGTEVVVW